MPIYIVVFIVGGMWEVLLRSHGVMRLTRDFLLPAFFLAYPACNLASLAAALGISFGVVIGKEIFGGTGKNLTRH